MYFDLVAQRARQSPYREHRLRVVARERPGEALVAPKMLPHMVRYLGSQSSKDSQQKIREVFDLDHFFSSPRRW